MPKRFLIFFTSYIILNQFAFIIRFLIAFHIYDDKTLNETPILYVAMLKRNSEIVKLLLEHPCINVNEKVVFFYLDCNNISNELKF